MSDLLNTNLAEVILSSTDEKLEHKTLEYEFVPVFQKNHCYGQSFVLHKTRVELEPISLKSKDCRKTLRRCRSYGTSKEDRLPIKKLSQWTQFKMHENTMNRLKSFASIYLGNDYQTDLEIQESQEKVYIFEIAKLKEAFLHYTEIDYIIPWEISHGKLRDLRRELEDNERNMNGYLSSLFCTDRRNELKELISLVEKPWLNLQIDIWKKIDEVMEQISKEVKSLNAEYVAIRRKTLVSSTNEIIWC